MLYFATLHVENEDDIYVIHVLINLLQNPVIYLLLFILCWVTVVMTGHQVWRMRKPMTKVG